MLPVWEPIQAKERLQAPHAPNIHTLTLLQRRLKPPLSVSPVGTLGCRSCSHCSCYHLMSLSKGMHQGKG